MAQERIEIVVSERGAQGVAKQISAIGDASEKSVVQTNRLRNALTALTGALGVNVLKQTLDTYTNMTNRLRVVTNSTAELRVVQKELFDIATRSRTSFEGVTELYARMAFATKEVGTSQRDLLKVTESLNQAITISGASAIEAKAALIQLSQGLASGRLQGDELRSILEQMPIVAQAIADKMGIAFGEIRKVAGEGKITTKIIVDAVKEAGTRWEEMFRKLPPTIAGSLQVVQTQFMKTLGAMDEATGVSTAVAKAFLYLADNMNKVVGVAATLATALGLTLARYALDIAIGRMLDFLKLMVVGPIINFLGAVRLLAGGFLALSVNIALASTNMLAFLATGIGRIGTLFTMLTGGIGRVVTAFGALRVAGAASLLTLPNLATAARGALMLLLSPITMVRTAVGALTTGFTLLATVGIRAVSIGISALLTTVGAVFGMFFGLVKIIALVGVGMVTLGDQTKVAEGSIVTYRDVALAAWERLKTGMSALWGYMEKAWNAITKSSNDAFKGTGKSFFDYVRDVAKGMDMLVAGFQASYDTILSSWKSFPAALIDLIWQGLQKLWDLIVEYFVKMGKFLKESFWKIVSLDFDSIGSGGLDMKVEGAAQRVTDTWLDHFKRRQGEMGFFQNEVARLEQDATKIAEAEAAKRLKIAQENEEARRKLELTGIDKTKPGDENAKRKPKDFGDYLKELEREGQLALLTGDAYKIMNEQIEFSNKLRRELTESEKAQIAEVVKKNAELERQRNLLNEIKGPTEEYNLQIQSLNALYQQGAISLEEFNNKFYQLRENFLNGLPEATTFADGFMVQIEKMRLATRNGFGQMGTEVAKIFGPGGTLTNGIGDAVAQSIVFGKSFKEQIRGIAQSILSQLIGSLVKMGLNMVMNAALGQGLMAASTATGVAQAGALTAAYTPAAAMASLATGGTNAAAAGTGISTIFSLLASLAGSLFSGGGMFKEGGYTGALGTNDIAGLVHGQEFVINASATKRHRSLLEAINAGKDPVAPIVQAAQAPSMNVSITNEIPDAAYEVRPLNESEIEIIAKRVVRREAPEIIGNDLRNPNSRVSKGISNNTMSNRRR